MTGGDVVGLLWHAGKERKKMSDTYLIVKESEFTKFVVLHTRVNIAFIIVHKT